jgi:glycosyltransferase involved in cell wall biosynthesis
MRIIIDLQGAQTRSRFRGIGRYTLSLSKAMVQRNSNHEFIIVLNGQFSSSSTPLRREFFNILPEENIVTWHAPGPTCSINMRNRWRYEVATLIREAFIETLQPDWIHISSFLEGYGDNAVTSIGKFDQRTPVSVSIYDLIPLANPKDYLEPYPLFKKFYLSHVAQLRNASQLLAISEFSRMEAIELLDVDPDSVINISSAAEAIFKPLSGAAPETDRLLENLGIDGKFVLYTGGADKRKNLRMLINAYACLPADIRQNCRLVFAGKLMEIEKSNLQREARSSGLQEGELVLAGYVSDEELVGMYNRCSLYVFPSYHEGFGLPALEAMACGAPVIGARASSLVEVIDNPEALFDPRSQASLGE